MNHRNYQREMENLISSLEKENRVPRLLLHSCCGPCSSSCLERLTDHFEVTVFYFNPNISPAEEYFHRVEEQERLVSQFPHRQPLHFLSGEYDPDLFREAVRGLEEEPEGGARCSVCYALRLAETARAAEQGEYDYFTTTLSVSPLKDADRINRIGEELASKSGKTAWLPSDFKKKDGYRRSVELSREYGLYRQDYCGCIYSLRRDFVPARMAEKKQETTTS